MLYINKNFTYHCDDYLARIIQTRSLHIEQEVVPTPDGGCDIHVEEMTKFRLITWVMHQCGRATVLQPENCRKEVAVFAETIKTLHKS